MGTESDKDFRFLPRPEANKMKWAELLPPVQTGLFDLLVRIEGAIAADNAKDKDKDDDVKVAHCFLVHGDRGTGKTTVLLSAKHAVASATGYARGTDDSFWTIEKGKTADPRQGERAREYASRLSETHWLDLLDLQPLPEDANLLTSVITRVRNALDTRNDTDGERGPLSLMDERATGPRSRLDRLVNDATLMWESIREQDTRNRVSRQMAAADIYANFRHQFESAIEELSRHLADRRGGHSAHCPIILPIDNIDRSSAHLYSIVKMAQIVSCKYLWLIVAGDRTDVETFLERAYWKELIRVEGGAIAMGKEAPGGEDEAFVMARRQAAAAFQKLIPPSHRIEIHPVEPLSTLAFSPSGNQPDIRTLLTRVTIPCGSTKEDTSIQRLRLIHLFEPNRSVDETNEGSTSPRAETTASEDDLSLVARNALRLPARGALDLWQIADWAIHNPIDSAISADPGAGDGKNDPQAEKIVRTMLRNVIAASKLSNRVGRFLQEKIVRRRYDRGTLLDFTAAGNLKIDLKISPLTAFGYEVQLPVREVDPCGNLLGDGPPCDTPDVAKGTRLYRSSSLRAHSIEDIIISLDMSRDGDDRTEDELPPLVAGWLAVLYDILVFTDAVAIINAPQGLERLSSSAVSIGHQVTARRAGRTCMLAETELKWPAPPWDTFLAHDRFIKLWESGRERFRRLLLSPETRDPTHGQALMDNLICCMLAYWVGCAIQTATTSSAGIHDGNQNGDSPTKVLSELLKLCCASEARSSDRDGPDAAAEAGNTSITVPRCDQSTAAVFREIGPLYRRLLEVPRNIRSFSTRERERVLRKWLETELPMLLGGALVPLSSRAAEHDHFETATRSLTEAEASADQSRGRPDAEQLLNRWWTRNAAFIVAELDHRLDAGKRWHLNQDPDAAGETQTGEECRPVPGLVFPELAHSLGLDDG